jgi:hypothetical protein
MRDLLVRLRLWLARRAERAGPFERWLATLLRARYAGQLTCRDLEAFAYDYYEGDLSPRQRRIFELHLAQCPMCRAHFAGYLLAIQMGQRLFAREERDRPPDVPEELVQAILAARASE